MFHFARIFTRTVGISPHRYVSWLRLKNAMTEITAGRLPLAQIAFNARFASQASLERQGHQGYCRAARCLSGENADRH
jgi:AraC family transcriptional regulator